MLFSVCMAVPLRKGLDGPIQKSCKQNCNQLIIFNESLILVNVRQLRRLCKQSDITD